MPRHESLKVVLIIVVAFVAIPSALGLGPKLTPIYRFPDNSTGVYPYAGVIADAKGNFYGTTFEGGAYNLGSVYELTPPAKQGGHWNETVLYSFSGGNDGENPYTALTLDGSGNLYGTAQRGQYSNTATVFEVSSNGSSWTFSTIFSFNPADFGVVYLGGPMIFDEAGNLYGEASEGGQTTLGFVYQLTPPTQQGGAWTGAMLYNFQDERHGDGDGAGPRGSLTFDASGNLYGTATYHGSRKYQTRCDFAGCGVVFQLHPPIQKGGAWTENILYYFKGRGDGGNPEGGVALDGNGNLFGTATDGGAYHGTNGAGVVFELTPRTSGQWAEKALYTFQPVSSMANPYAGVAIDGVGNLYGTTANGGRPTCPYLSCGAVYKLAPPAKKGHPWKITPLHLFGVAPDGTGPVGNLLLLNGAVYGTTSYGGDEKNQECKNAGGCGMIYKIVP